MKRQICIAFVCLVSVGCGYTPKARPEHTPTPTHVEAVATAYARLVEKRFESEVIFDAWVQGVDEFYPYSFQHAQVRIVKYAPLPFSNGDAIQVAFYTRQKDQNLLGKQVRLDCSYGSFGGDRLVDWMTCDVVR